MSTHHSSDSARSKPASPRCRVSSDQPRRDHGPVAAADVNYGQEPGEVRVPTMDRAISLGRQGKKLFSCPINPLFLFSFIKYVVLWLSIPVESTDSDLDKTIPGHFL